MAQSASDRLEQLQDGVRAAPKDSELNINLGEAFLRVNQVDEAVIAYERAIELDPRSDLRALYWEWLGIVREMEGRLEEALDAYFQWIDADPVAISPLDRLATLLVALGRWTDLQLLDSQYTRRCEMASSALSRESLALYSYVTNDFTEDKEDKLEGARKSTLKALEEDPDSLSLRFLLGIIAYQQGDIDTAQAEFERVVELDSDERWLEQRFSLGWSGAKARVMLAKIARSQGHREIALSLLGNVRGLESHDLEDVTEAAELMLESCRYDELTRLLANIPSSPSRIGRLKAEGLLGLGMWGDARSLYELEAVNISRQERPSSRQEQLKKRLGQVWQLYLDGKKSLAKEIEILEREFFDELAEEPIGAALAVLLRVRKKQLSGFALLGELEKIARRFPASVEVWRLVEDVLKESGQVGVSQLATLARSKLEYGNRQNSSGGFTTSSKQGLEVISAISEPGEPVLVVKIEAEIGRMPIDQLFGWGAKELQSSLSLAKGVLEDLGDSQVGGPKILPELSLFPRGFRLMTTRLTPFVRQESGTNLGQDMLDSVPCAMLVALIHALNDRVARNRLLVLARLGLRGNIDGVSNLEETLLALAENDIEWDHLVLARAGAFRLLRCPPKLWYGRPLTLIDKASDLLDLGLSPDDTSRAERWSGSEFGGRA